ncbi:MAG TPA: AraC family transcriptional regulator [Steroidobacteraceae bacterium]|nr:AraC family transcriptional regulator [Steroidobacteraceae bacterium]
MPGLSLLRADFTDHEYRPHVHSEMVVAVTESGGAIITAHGLEAEARPDRLFVLNPEEVQSARMGQSRRWVYRSFYFGEEALEDIRRGLGLPRQPSFPSSAIGDATLILGFRSLHLALEQRSDVSEIRERLLQVFARMYADCGTAVSSIEARPDDWAQFRKVAEVVREHRLDELRLDSLAAVANLTVFQLIRLFKRVAGLTPHAYLVQLRLDEARRHLRNGMPIAEAAMAAGFYDQSALSNHFRRSYGITPAQYAIAVRD